MTQDGQLLAEADAGTQKITRQYIWLGQKPVAYLFGDKGYYVHTDNLDTPQVLTDSQQKVVWTTQTYPFGKQQYSGSIPFNLRCPGQYFDEETGLHYNGHRYYDPNTGRYITSDPIGLAGGLNTYAYVGSNPLSFVDPLGLDAEDGFHTKPISIAPENANSEKYESGSPGENPYQNLQILDFSGVVASVGENVCGIHLSKNRYPESSKHIIEAVKLGKPITLTIDRKNASSRRRDALKNTPPVKTLDRDEYPPAMFKEGGKDASVRLISPSDNRGAGSCIGSQCRNLPDGTKVKINIVE